MQFLLQFDVQKTSNNKNIKFCCIYCCILLQKQNIAFCFLAACFAEHEERSIINGYDSPYRKFYVQLDLPNDAAECGGTIINENFILIAAHCVYEQKG